MMDRLVKIIIDDVVVLPFSGEYIPDQVARTENHVILIWHEEWHYLKPHNVRARVNSPRARAPAFLVNKSNVQASTTTTGKPPAQNQS